MDTSGHHSHHGHTQRARSHGRTRMWMLRLLLLALALPACRPCLAQAAVTGDAPASPPAYRPSVVPLRTWEEALWTQYEECGVAANSPITPAALTQPHTHSSTGVNPQGTAQQLDAVTTTSAGGEHSKHTALNEPHDEAANAHQPDEPTAGSEAQSAATAAAAAAASLRARGRPPLPSIARGKPLLTLVMIVKNEMRSLPATLNSVLGVADRFSIVDTGSTDGSSEFIAAWFAKHLESDQYALHHADFVDFSTTRNLALKLAGDASEFILFLNGDDRLVKGRELRTFLEERRFLRGTDEAMYIVPIHYGGLAVGRSERISRSANHFVKDWPNDAINHWRYEGVTHEVYVCQAALQGGVQMVYTPADSFHIYHDVTYDTKESKRERFQLDVELLLREIKTDAPDGSAPANRARSIYYLAQSYYNLGHLRDAMDWYKRRVSTNYPRPTAHNEDNEKARSYSIMASMVGRLGGEKEEMEQYLSKAHDHCATSHSLFQLAAFYTDVKPDRAKAMRFAQQAQSYLRDPSKASMVCGDDQTVVAQQLPQLMRRIKQIK